MFDYKKAFKEFYMPPAHPTIVTLPPVRFIAVRGTGDPNEPDGEYSRATQVLYAIAYTLKMSKNGTHPIEGYFEYVVPPLEGFWWQDGITGVDYTKKDAFSWIAVNRLPEFVREEDFRWAVAEAARKKNIDSSMAEYFTYDEGLCVQCLHIGAYEDEPATTERMHCYMQENGYALDLSSTRMHHEIYLSDPRKTVPDKLKTVLRHPIRKKP